MTFVSVVVIALACIVISYFVLYYRRRLSFTKTVKHLPGPTALPLIGNAYYFLQRNHDEFLDIMIRFGEDYPSPFQIWTCNKSFIGVYDPDQIKTILQSPQCVDKSVIYKFLKPILGTGLLIAPASIWIPKRKMVATGFNTNILQGFFDIFVEQSLALTDELEKFGLNGNEIIFLEYILSCTLKTAFETVTGFKIESSLNHRFNRVIKAIISIKEILRYRMQNVAILYPDIIFNLTAARREQRKNLNLAFSFLDEIIQQQMHANKLNTTKTKDMAFFNILMETTCKEQFTLKKFRDNILAIILGASETTAITINFAVFMLANFPEIQEKVYKEQAKIYDIKTPKPAPVKYEDLQYMHYLECVIKETMRLFPAIPIIARRLTEDLKIGEFILPKDGNIFMMLLMMHRNDKYWSNPLVFDPDRFLPENIRNSSHCYFPFSSGPRNCIGMRYGMMSMKVILATLVRTFVFKVDEIIEIDKIKLGMDMILRTIEPLKIKIERKDISNRTVKKY